MSGPLPVFLFDLDGVLVEPHGYRLAIQASLRYYTDRMGFTDLYPGEDGIARLEAIDMTSEWDITSILLAGILDAAAGELAGPDRIGGIPAELNAACDWLRGQGLPSPRLDLPRLIDRLAPAFHPGVIYSALALELSRRAGEASPFPNLRGHPLLEHILADTRSLDAAPVTRVFQHFCLGSQRYADTFHRPALFGVESYLQRYDRRLIRPETCALVRNAQQAGKLSAAACTARPSVLSAPLQPNGRVMYQYSPEAELALELADLREITLIGAGQVCWLAETLGRPSDQFIKPSPVQSLAAIGAALTGDPAGSLLSAERLIEAGEPGLFAALAPLSIHIFEDSGGNIQAVRQAAAALERAGVASPVSAWGIADNPAKQAALRRAGAELVPDINVAVHRALLQEGLAA